MFGIFKNNKKRRKLPEKSPPSDIQKRRETYRRIPELQNKPIKESMITVGLALNIRTADDARRKDVKGAQWSSVDDACPLCKYLDNMVISIDHPDFERVVPPLHDGCKCIRIYIGTGQTNVTYDWVSPPQELWDKHAK